MQAHGVSVWCSYRYVDAPKKVVPTPTTPQRTPEPSCRADAAGPSQSPADSLHAHHILGGIPVDGFASDSEEEDMGLGMLAG